MKRPIERQNYVLLNNNEINKFAYSFDKTHVIIITINLFLWLHTNFVSFIIIIHKSSCSSFFFSFEIESECYYLKNSICKSVKPIGLFDAKYSKTKSKQKLNLHSTHPKIALFCWLGQSLRIVWISVWHITR